MDRLDFELPEFTRIMWATDRAREVWEPRIVRIRNAWMEIEGLAVAQGVRRCCVTFATPEEFVLKGSAWAQLGLNALPVEICRLSHYTSPNRTQAVEPGKPFVFRIVLGKHQDVLALKAAYDVNDDQAIAELLGYPPCCHKFYRRVWIDEGGIDTTWPMAVATRAPGNGDRILRLDSAPESNILWRWMGVRAVSHLPCRFDCSETIALGKILLAIGRQAGYHQEIDWLVEILSWPVEWSALHGIAEIKTPVLKVSTNTDATATKYVVQRVGSSYPKEVAPGLNFPYQIPERLHLTDSRGFKQGIGNPFSLVQAPAESGCGKATQQLPI